MMSKYGILENTLPQFCHFECTDRRVFNLNRIWHNYPYPKSLYRADFQGRLRGSVYGLRSYDVQITGKYDVRRTLCRWYIYRL